jgi:hypothetical protein
MNFTRGENPKKSIGIGRILKIEEWFRIYASDAEYFINDDLFVEVEGYLDIYKRDLEEIPFSFSVKRYLFLRASKILELPPEIYVDGWMDISHTLIEKLPSKIYIKEDLFIRKSQIKKFPPNLKIGGKIIER